MREAYEAQLKQAQRWRTELATEEAALKRLDVAFVAKVDAPMPPGRNEPRTKAEMMMMTSPRKPKRNVRPPSVADKPLRRDDDHNSSAEGAISVEVFQVQCCVIEISPLDCISWHVKAIISISIISHPL